MATTHLAQLSDSVIEGIEHALAKFPPDKRQSAIMPALTLVQEENGGWLTETLMDAVADYLRVPNIQVYEVATFYSMYELKPVGRHKICVCTSLSCMLNGSDELLEHLQTKLGVKLGEVTPDGKFSLKRVECLAACGGAPMFQIGDNYYENLTFEKVDAILDGLE